MRRKLTLLALACALAIGATACDNQPLVSEEVLFEVGEHELTPEAQPQLADVAEQIRAAGAGGTVTLAGHADDQGSDSLNQDLSERRTASVQDALEELLADTEVTYEATGHGSTQPQVPNDSDENRAQNRRVEVMYFR